jgi:hypothetical protein
MPIVRVNMGGVVLWHIRDVLISTGNLLKPVPNYLERCRKFSGFASWSGWLKARYAEKVDLFAGL